MITQETKYRVLKILEREPKITQRQLAKELDVSLGKTHYVIKSLIDLGWVKLSNFKKSNNKWGYAYLLTREGVTGKALLTVSFLKKKKEEYNQIQQEIAELKREIEEQVICSQRET